MGRKRKAGQPFGAKSHSPPAQTRFDVNERFDDSEDEFLAGRDQVLLDEGPDSKRRRKLREEEEALQPSDEEILGYDSEAQSASEDIEDSEDEQNGVEADITDGDIPSRDSGSEEDEVGENLRDWGTTRESYYNADAIETEADALEEEAEAKRIQQKRLQDMTEADYGFDETEWVDSTTGGEEKRNKRTVREQLPDLVVTEDLDEQERLKILKNRYPEFEPLTKDYVDLRSTLEDLRLAAEASRSASDLSKKRNWDQANSTIPLSSSVAVTKWRALSAYLGSIAMYLAILTSTASKFGRETQTAMVPRELHSHPIINTVFRCRQSWEIVKDIQIPAIESGQKPDTTEIVSKPQLNGHLDATPTQTSQKKKKKLSKSQKAALSAKVAVEKERAERMEKAEAKLAGLSSLLRAGKQRPTTVTSTRNPDQEPDFGDEAPLTAAEAAEKARKKKSLRFYTSQIAQKANKRGEKTRDAGGDTDLLYKERVIDKRERLNREAEKRGKGTHNKTDLGEAESDSDEQARIASELRRDYDNDDNEIFDYIAAQKSKKAAQKATRASAFVEASAQASKFGARVHKAENVDEDGRRGVTYEIRKNRGLAPKRAKETRNPRIRQKKRFEEKTKKLGSIRPVYKGGEGRGGYGGELTGISRNVVKSVKL